MSGNYYRHHRTSSKTQSSIVVRGFRGVESALRSTAVAAAPHVQRHHSVCCRQARRDLIPKPAGVRKAVHENHRGTLAAYLARHRCFADIDLSHMCHVRSPGHSVDLPRCTRVPCMRPTGASKTAGIANRSVTAGRWRVDQALYRGPTDYRVAGGAHTPTAVPCLMWSS